MSDNVEIDGLILAGGQSRRMGEDKAHLEVAGKTLLQHHVQQMLPQVMCLYVAANDRGEEENSPNICYIRDHFAGSQGPLSGLLAALERSDADYLWLMSCDNYGLPSDFLSQLKVALQESGADIACLSIAGRHQPLMSLMRCDLHDALAQYMASGARAVLRWYDCLDVVDVELPVDSFWYNINTRDDFQALLSSL